MNTAKHSPYTLCRKGDYNDFGGQSRVLMIHDGTVNAQRIAAFHVATREDSKRAAEITKAANLHDELVAALTEVAFDAQYPDHKIGAETLRRIKELLARARQ